MKKLIFVFILFLSENNFGQFTIGIDSICMTKEKSELKQMLIEKNNLIEYKTDLLNNIFARGVIKKYLGDPAGALSDFDKVISTDKKFGDAYTERGILKNELKDFKGAMEDFDAMLALNKFSPEAYLGRGNNFFLQKKYKEAIVEFNTSISLRKNGANAYAQKAGAQMMLGDTTGAIKTCTDFINVRPQYKLAYWNRSVIYIQVGNLNAALEDVNRSVELSGNDPETLIERAAFLDDLVNDNAAAVEDCDLAIKKNPSKAKYYYRRASAEYDLGKYDAVMNDCNKAIELDKECIDAYVLRGNTFDGQKKFDLAVADYKKALQIKPGDVITYKNLGDTYMKIPDFENAIKIYDTVLKIDPKDTLALNNRGSSKFLIKNYAGTVNDFTLLIQLKPTNGLYYMKRAAAKDSLHDKTGACEDMLKTCELGYEDGLEYLKKNCPDKLTSKRIKVMMLEVAALEEEQKGNFSKAIEIFTEVIKLWPDSASGYFNRGFTKRKMKNFEGAIEDYKISQSKNQYYSAARVAMGVALTLLNKKDEAIKVYEECIKICPKESIAYYNLSDIYTYSNTQKEKIIPLLKKAIFYNPKYVKAWFHLGEMYREAGDMANACAAYKKVQDLGDDSADMKIILYCK